MLYTNCELANIRSVHTYLLPWMFYFGGRCTYSKDISKLQAPTVNLVWYLKVPKGSHSFFRMRLKSSSSAWLIKDVSRCLFQIKFHFCKLKWIVYLISLNFYMDLDRKHLESWDLQIWITNVKNFLIVDFWTNAVIANYFVR